MMERFTRSGTSIVPPTPDELARARRDDGMERAGRHADAEHKDWRDKALGYVRLYAVASTGPFLTEDVRVEAEKDGLPLPPDRRAWGSVLQRAAREGIVTRAGYAPAHSSNLSPKCLWAAS